MERRLSQYTDQNDYVNCVLSIIELVRKNIALSLDIVTSCLHHTAVKHITSVWRYVHWIRYHRDIIVLGSSSDYTELRHLGLTEI